MRKTTTQPPKLKRGESFCIPCRRIVRTGFAYNGSHHKTAEHVANYEKMYGVKLVKVGDRVCWVTGNRFATAEWEGIVQRVDNGFAYMTVAGYDSLAIVATEKLTVLRPRAAAGGSR